jgi:hypothetical protein
VEFHEGGTVLLGSPMEHPSLLTSKVCGGREYKL